MTPSGIFPPGRMIGRGKRRRGRNVLNIMLVSLVLIASVIAGEVTSLGYHPDRPPDARSNSVRSSSFPTSSEHLYSLCILDLASRSGAPGQTMRLILQAVSGQTEKMREYLLAIGYVESRYRPDALSHAGAVGVMQVTPPAVEHCDGQMSRAYTVSDNMQYGMCYLEHAVSEAGGDMRRALILYNGGYKQLARYDRGASIVSETANYVLAVERIVTICSM